MTSLAHPFGAADGLRYGLLGLPLAFVALPLYVVVPHHYASAFGIPLALLGGVLLVARLLDALVDPLIGRGVDRLYARSARAVLGLGGIAACLLALGFYLLFFPPVREVSAVLAWLAATLAVTYLAFSVLTVAHQSWGAMLGGDEAQRARIVGWREGLGVAGVLVASVAPSTLGLTATAAIFAVLLAAGWLAWARSRPPQAQATPHAEAGALWLPLRRTAFRRLLAVFMLNGIASAVPATLVLFFVQDRLQAPRSWEPAFLGLYFLCAALSIPLWLRLVRRAGLARSWLVGMGLAIAAFVWTAGLGEGDAPMFLAVCAASGFALGADLALPLLGLAGYAPGARDAQALSALTFAYGVLPCVLKLMAAAGLYLTLIRPHTATTKATP